jgi:SAM-dependent methyltransferase
VSQQERNDDCLTDEALVYGELNYEIFATMYEKITKAWGGAPQGKFFDLGCGVGQLVYTAAMINENKFEACGGIEVIGNLLDRGVKRMLRWDTKVKVNFPNEVKNTRMLWANEDLFKSAVWHDATFLVIHWTAYSNKQVAALSDQLRVCKEGTHIITITHPIINNDDDFELLVKDECVTSWGDADFFVYEKLTTSKAIG